MGNLIFVLVVAAAIYGGWYYLETFIFFEWVREQAATKESRYVINPREKRTIQRTIGKEFNTLWYNSADECFEWQLYPYKKFKNERDRWWIVSGKYDVRDTMNLWQKYIYNNTGVWWYQGWSREYEIYKRELDVKHYEPAINTGEAGKMIPLANKMSIYLFRTSEGYGVTITGAEDLTGNPVTVHLILPGRVANPYIANVEIETWDKLFPARVRAKAVGIIHRSHFYQGIPIKPELKDQYVAKGQSIPRDKDEIMEILRDELRLILVENPDITPRDIIVANGGFEFSDVLPQDIIMENKDIINAIAKTVVSEEEMKQEFNRAEGLASIEEKPGMAKNRVLDNKLKIMSQYPKMARLSAIEESLKGTKALALGTTDFLFANYDVNENELKSSTTKEVKNESNEAA